jgi:hypothetical protein
MQCRCGSHTQSRSSVVSKLAAELFYQECGQCARVGIEYLKVNNVIVLRGKEAQETFNGNLADFINTPQQAGFGF